MFPCNVFEGVQCTIMYDPPPTHTHSSMEKGLSSETKNSPDTQPLHAAHLQSGEQPISSEGQSEDMGPWTGATEEPSSRTRYVCIMCSYAVQ